ncbi:glycosyltransferase family 90 protein [Aplosporella prunicola CBS 121167]|uniref:Glycosyltransferase family 90 protein n=1 Tax=Aplosporella prunicola CBS 121167 TaxID=1176127 RepID=A0A6A6BW37_9PEZI|nr:glycosyltransferase family 90 protein [Aplosporella prunicola CBS 121167]KAF2146911.1 glycosyltransferase family 90 protein [Aplosporella prunicola CBS 121167]
MDRAPLLWVSGLFACLLYIASTLDTSFAFDRPVHSSIAVLIVCGAALLLAQKIRPFHGTTVSNAHYAPIPLQDLQDGGAGSRPASPVLEGPGEVAKPTLFGLRARTVLVGLLLTARIEVLRRVLQRVECRGPSLTPLALVFVAVADWWQYRKMRQQPRDEEEVDEMETTIYVEFATTAGNSPLKTLFGVAIIIAGSIAAFSKPYPALSTYICPVTSTDSVLIPRLQTLGVFIDGLIGALLFQLLDSKQKQHSRLSSMGVPYVGLACLISATIWVVIGLSYYSFGPSDLREWISTHTQQYTGSAIKLALAISIAALCAVRTIHYVGVLSTSVIVLFTAVFVYLFGPAWNHNHPFPPLPGGGIMSLLVAVIGFIVHAMPTAQSHRGKLSLWTFLPVVLFLFMLQVMFAYHGSSEVRYHPIDMLMYYANENHGKWLKHAGINATLFNATTNYTARYGRHPPPHFDDWYNYAVERNTLIIDDFDNIYSDLLPFWALSPAEIRQRTWEVIADPDSGIGGIIIREGKVSISDNVPGTHRWMLDGVVEMIEKFSKWLPDMDLAFNLNDECRVAVPYDEMNRIRDTALTERSRNPGVVSKFSSDRSKNWQAVPQEPVRTNRFQVMSFKSTWDEFGTVACPPNSKARTQRIWDVSKLCTDCAVPHSLGGYLANWTLAADVCHQPDLARLHGFYTSPAAFSGTHDLMPIFSQGKASGYNDILYPSAWNYVEKAVYAPNDEYPDPPFEEKDPTLFWRGSTTEGMSTGHGEWRGMARQRLVHEAMNTSSTHALLLPWPISNNYKKQRYALVAASELHANFAPDVQFVSYPRCFEADCNEQFAEFAPREVAAPIDFQGTWRYRYILDADGAGFSGRFIPFLRSGSVPFKMALFREWLDGRVVPWVHFVPLDLRLQGLWATLAFFEGFNGTVVGGGRAVVGERRRHAERIAREGREWAEKVLRREDMEVYMFRLLLEWGRLTDDRRDELGFVVGGGGGGGS